MGKKITAVHGRNLFRAEQDTGNDVLKRKDSRLEAEDVLELLHARGIPFTLYQHPPLDNAHAASELICTFKGTICKTLFLEGKDRSLWLVTIPLNARVDLRELAVRLGSGRLSFGKGDVMYGHLGVQPGSVTPLGVLNDTQGAVRLALDASLPGMALLNIHPLINTMSIDIKPDDLINVVSDAGHEALLLEGICALPD